ncbi:MAG: aminotransferase class V-fold PLP-dependent enzyme [Gammaproteobacteria bacterium]|nr:aminotransferase class V-fold PLP-dependent enzyme [Gammaproteobacteria bacterium]
MTAKNSRRQFLHSSSAVLFGAAAATLQTSQAQNAKRIGIDSNATGEEYWRLVREQFSFPEDRVPMNAANLCPAFRAVTENVDLLTEDIDLDCSFNNRAKFGDLRENARTLVANQLNVSADEVALVRNTSEANNIINNGLKLEAGDEIILWDQNHPTNNLAWDVRAARFDLQIKRITTPAKPSSPGELVDAFTSQFSSRTKVLTLTHVSNLSGIKLPIAELVAAAHARGIYVHVDGAQVWGAMNLNLTALDVDSFSASAHKWYMGPKEVGLLYVKGNNIDRIWPPGIAPGWGNSVETTLVGARKFESLGQRDDATLAALGTAAEIHNSIGPDRIERRVVYLAQRLKAGISDLGLQQVTPGDPNLSFGVCITQAPAGQGGVISNRLYEEFGITGAATGGLRLSPTIYNTEEHLDRAVAGLKALMT